MGISPLGGLSGPENVVVTPAIRKSVQEIFQVVPHVGAQDPEKIIQRLEEPIQGGRLKMWSHPHVGLKDALKLSAAAIGSAANKAKKAFEK